MKITIPSKIAGSLALAAVCLVWPAAASSVSSISPSWHQQNRTRLADGKVVVFPPSRTPSFGAQLAAAIHVDASSQEIWRVITDPSNAPKYLSNLKDAHVVKSTSTSQLISHTVKAGLLPNPISYRFQTTQTPCTRIRFKLVDGDLRSFEGSWQLIDGKSVGQGGGTVIFYQIYLDAGELLPQSMVRKSLSRNLPQMLELLRERIYSLQRA